MPITQPRLLSLLEAAEAYLKLYRQNVNLVAYYNTQIRDGHVTPEAAFHDMALMLVHQPIPAEHLNTILEERTRYNLTHSRNARLAKQKARLRQTPEGRSPTPVAHIATRPLNWINPDDTDEALQGLDDLAAESGPPPPPPDPTLDPMAHDPAYLAWKRAQGHQP